MINIFNVVILNDINNLNNVSIYVSHSTIYIIK
jgi:hypothetical protein